MLAVSGSGNSFRFRTKNILFSYEDFRKQEAVSGILHSGTGRPGEGSKRMAMSCVQCLHLLPGMMFSRCKILHLILSENFAKTFALKGPDTDVL